MSEPILKLSVVEGSFAISRLDPTAPPPAWAAAAGIWSITRTADELSVVCPEELVPAGVQVERGWACLAVAGPLDLSEVGILATLSLTLAQAGVSIFALSTYDTDYLLVRREQLEAARLALQNAGHQVS